jgi:hypothetical protein
MLSDGAGLTGRRAQVWTESSQGVQDDPAAGDRFGAALARVNFDDNSVEDLAIGVPGEDLPGAVDAGAVHILHGSSGGFFVTYDPFLTQQGEETPESGDLFGSALGGVDDIVLAIGAPGEDLDTPGGVIADAGAVSLHYFRNGSSFPLDVDEVWTQESPDVLDAAEPGDGFGYRVSVFGARAGTLAIGVREDIEASIDAGAINVLYRPDPEGRFSATNNQLWIQGGSGLAGTPEPADHFGSALLP